jgi:hypothetical protein
MWPVKKGPRGLHDLVQPDVTECWYVIPGKTAVLKAAN